MPRILAVVLVLVVSTMCLPSDWTVGQEAKQKCKQCPGHPTANALDHLKFELPGIDFPVGIQVEVEHNKTADGHAIVGGSIEIECECLKNSGIPFLSNVPGGMGALFTNIGLPPHPSCCAAAKTDECDGKCCAIDSDCCPDECKVGGQESDCEKCDCCPSNKTGVPIKGSDRLLTAVHASSNTCQACEQSKQCQSCDGCSAACGSKKIQSTGHLDIQSHPQAVQLVGYVENSADKVKGSRSAAHPDAFELRLENERLKMAVEAAENRLEMMEAMIEIREENAILRTKIEYLETQSVSPTHAPHRVK